MLLTCLFACFPHHLILQFWDFHSLHVYMGTHIHRHSCSHTSMSTHKIFVTHRCTHAYTHSYHLHFYIHTHLSVSPSLFFSSPTPNNSSAYKTKWYLWIIDQCSLWNGIAWHLRICYKCKNTALRFKPANSSFWFCMPAKHLNCSYSYNYSFFFCYILQLTNGLKAFGKQKKKLSCLFGKCFH